VTARGETTLWLVQRAAALFLALAVLIHLATILYAVRHGLDAASLLARTRGNALFLAFYGAFATAAALHGGIGLRTVLAEWTRWRGRSLDLATLLAVAVLAIAGWRAALALYGAAP